MEPVQYITDRSVVRTQTEVTRPSTYLYAFQISACPPADAAYKFTRMSYLRIKVSPTRIKINIKPYQAYKHGFIPENVLTAVA